MLPFYLGFPFPDASIGVWGVLCRLIHFLFQKRLLQPKFTREHTFCHLRHLPPCMYPKFWKLTRFIMKFPLTGENISIDPRQRSTVSTAVPGNCRPYSDRVTKLSAYSHAEDGKYAVPTVPCLPFARWQISIEAECRLPLDCSG